MGAATAVAVAGCGGSGTASPERCLLGTPGVERIAATFGSQRFVHFSDGSRVGIVLERSHDEASRLASAAAGPGDPYAYEAVGRAVVAWRGAAADPHLRAVERCLR